MEALKYIAVCLFAYLCGSFNTSIFISKHLYGIDVRNYGSGNAGATNTLRTLGVKKAFVVLLGDIVKVVVPVLAARWAGIVYPELIAGSFAVIGHSKPIYYGFKGGKGVATSLGVLIMSNWQIGLICLVFALILIVLTQMVSVGSIAAAVLYPVLTLFIPQNYIAEGNYLIYSILLAVLIIFNHRENVKRLLNGTENRISFKGTN